MPVPFWLAREAAQAVEICPALALTLSREEPPAAVAARPEPPAAVPARPAPPAWLAGSGGSPGDEGIEGLVVTESWISQLGG
jgi:hypothetical protein